MKVKLSEIVEGMEEATDSLTYYLRKADGLVFSMDDEIACYGSRDDEEDGPELPDWMAELVELARDIEKNRGDYLELPTRQDLNMYRLMEAFSQKQEAEALRERLLNVIRGSGAFRRFRQTLAELHLRDAWDDFKEAAFFEFARSWCEENGLEYEEGR